MKNNIIMFPDKRALLVKERRKRARITHWRIHMLVGNKCEISNHLYGSPDCPSDLANLEKLSGMIISGPHFKEQSHEYSILAILDNGRLFKSTSDYVTLTDYVMPPF